MTAIRLKSNVGHCEVDGTMIFLDVARDRYLQLPRNREMDFRGMCAAKPVDPLAVSALLDTGLFEVVPDNCAVITTVRCARPSRAIDGSNIRRRMEIRFVVHWVRALTLLIVFHGLSRRQSLQNSLNLARLLSRNRLFRAKDCDHNILLAAFNRAAILFPRKDRCLPDALALFSLFVASGRPVQIAFGVQLSPFQAHCWVQQNDVVLGQDIENVQAFSPILTVS